MNTKKILSIIFGVILSFAALLPVARADDSNQEARLTFSQAVEIPGRVLPAGTYWFRVLDSTSYRGVVQVSSEDRKTVFATLITANSQRLESADETTLQFAKRQSAGPAALVTWFSPGEIFGHEFLYRKPEERELARDEKENVVAGPEIRTGF